MKIFIFVFLILILGFSAWAQKEVVVGKIVLTAGSTEEVKVQNIKINRTSLFENDTIQTGAGSTVTFSLKSPDGKKETTVYLSENSKVHISQGVLNFVEGTVSVVTKGAKETPFTVKTPSGNLSLKEGFLTSMVVKEENKAPQAFVLQSSGTVETSRGVASNQAPMVVTPLSFFPKNVSMMLDNNPTPIFSPSQRLTKTDVLSGDSAGPRGGGIILGGVKNTGLESSSKVITTSATSPTSASNRAIAGTGKCP